MNDSRAFLQKMCIFVQRWARRIRCTESATQPRLQLADLDWAVPDYSTLFRLQRTLAAQIPYEHADGHQNLLVDRNGTKFLGGGEWRAFKYCVTGLRRSCKDHLTMDTVTSDIRAVAIAAIATMTTAQP